MQLGATRKEQLKKERTTILIIRERKSFVIHQTQVLRIQRKGGYVFVIKHDPFELVVVLLVAAQR